MGKNKKILIFNVNWLGDVLFSTATIRNIRRNFPSSFISCVIPSRCYQVLKGNPHLNEIIIFDEKDRHKGPLSKFSFIRSLKHKKFDMVVLLHGSLTRALICRLAGIPERVGYDTKNRGFLLTKKIPVPPRDKMHRVDYYLNIIEEYGIKPEDRYSDFYFDENDAKSAEDFLAKHKITPDDFLTGINPGGNWLPKRWPKEYWAELADKLISEFKAKVVITGSDKDMLLAKQISSLMKEKPIISCGVFNLKQSAALYKKMKLFICADSGPLHIANSVGCPKIIAIFGPTDPAITGPVPSKNVVILKKDIGCVIPCYKVDCKDNRCMKVVKPADLIQEIRSIGVN